MIRTLILRLIYIPVIILLCFSCGNEIRLFPEDLPSAYMVYGILDANSEDQFVKIRRTFGGNTDLEAMAGNPELFNPPDSLRVRIEEWKEEGITFHNLTRNSLDKSPGLFSEDVNIIYQGLFLPVGERRYDLFIKDPETGEEIKASTNMIDPPNLRFPTVGNTKYRFTDTLNHFYVKYQPTGAVHFQQFYINFVEIMNSGDTLFRTVNFEVTPRFREPERPVVTYTRTYPRDYVLNIIHMLIEADNDVIERQLYSFDFVVWAGDEYLKDYIKLAGKFNDNRRQFFSNIDGGMGLFASCSHSRIEGVWPLQEFFDLLESTPKLEGLNFSNQRFKGEFVKPVNQMLFPGQADAGHVEYEALFE